MKSKVEDARERRRAQNRIAQRRHRQKQSLQKAADRSKIKDNPYPNRDTRSQEVPSSDPSSPGLSNLPVDVDSVHYSGGLDVDSLLLDGIGFLDNSFTQTPDSAHSSRQISLASSPGIDQITSSPDSSRSPTSSDGITAQDFAPLSNPSPGSLESGSRLSPLHIAAQKGHDRIVCILLQQNIDCNEKDGNGLTPIIHAVIGGYEDVVRSLLLYGAQVSDTDRQQRSTIHLAVRHSREGVLEDLLNHCRDDMALIDGYDMGGRTPLHLATDTGFEAGVIMLLRFGANPQCKTRKSS